MKVTRFGPSDASSSAGGAGGGGGGSSPGGVAGGDLGGSYPAPVVTGIGGNPVSTATPTTGDALVWNGTEWTPTASTATDGMVPYYIAVDDTFTVPLYKQALFKNTIENDGILVVLGQLLGVD